MSSRGILLLLGIGVGSWPAAAQTCPCPTVPLRTLVSEAEVIFVGRALSATTDSDTAVDSDGAWRSGKEILTRLLFDVHTAIKGDPSRFTEVTTPTGLCGFPFAVGQTYLVMGRGQGAAVVTDACKGNVTGADAVDARAAAIENILHPPPVRQQTPAPR